MPARGSTIAGLVLVCAVVACSADADQGSAPATTSSAADVVTTQSTASTVTTTEAPVTSSTSPERLPSTTTVPSTTSSSTSTTQPAPTTTEAARSRPPSVLSRPNGFARFEPLPAWEGDAPLTGLPVDPDVWRRPALAVKIDNSPGGRPQWNVADADLVIEENVEQITRLIAVYQSVVPDRVGPVRSARTSDIDILSGLNRPILAWSGGNPGVTGDVRGAHQYGWLSNLSALQTDCFWRSSTRAAPHNLLLDPACAWNSTTYAGPARPLFARDAGGVPPGRGEDRFTVAMDGIDVTWVWEPTAGRYQRRQRGDWHVDVDGAVIGAENVVELEVEYRPSSADARSPEAVTVGSGRAVVHRGGVAVVGTWSRPDRSQPFTLVADDGTPITLGPGTTFVELER